MDSWRLLCWGVHGNSLWKKYLKEFKKDSIRKKKHKNVLFIVILNLLNFSLQLLSAAITRNYYWDKRISVFFKRFVPGYVFCVWMSRMHIFKECCSLTCNSWKFAATLTTNEAATFSEDFSGECTPHSARETREINNHGNFMDW